MVDWQLRLRAVLDRHIVAVAVVLVAVALLGGWVTYGTYVDPGTTSEQRPGPSWETVGAFEHGATVQRENPVFPVNATLENRSVYFTRITPRLEGAYTFGYEASESGRLEETVSLSLVIRELADSDREGNATVLWRTTRPLNVTERSAVRPGETVRVPFSINVSAVENRTAQIQERLGSSPGQTDVRIRATVAIDGTVNGESVDRTTTDAMPLSLSGDTYSVADAGPTTAQYESTRTVTVEETYGPLRKAGGPALVLVSLIGLAGIATARYRDLLALSAAERDQLAYEDDRTEFEEWISTIQLPDEAFDLPRAEATSLGELVDLAIDTNNRVIEDPSADAYYVRHDGYLYTYRPPTTLGYRRPALGADAAAGDIAANAETGSAEENRGSSVATNGTAPPDEASRSTESSTE